MVGFVTPMLEARGGA